MEINLKYIKYQVQEYNNSIKITGNIIIDSNRMNFSGKVFYTDSLIGYFNCSILKNKNLITNIFLKESFDKKKIEAMINDMANQFKLEVGNKL